MTKLCCFHFGDVPFPVAIESPRLRAAEAGEVRNGRTLLRGKAAVAAPLHRLRGAEEMQEGYLHKTDEQTFARCGSRSMPKVQSCRNLWPRPLCTSVGRWG